MNWWIDGTCWKLCKVIKRIGNIATVQLWDSVAGDFAGDPKTGRARPGLYGLLVEAK